MVSDKLTPYSLININFYNCFDPIVTHIRFSTLDHKKPYSNRRHQLKKIIVLKQHIKNHNGQIIFC